MRQGAHAKRASIGAAIVAFVAVVLGAGKLLVKESAFPSSDIHIPLGRGLERVTTWGTDNLTWFYDPIATTLTNSFNQLVTQIANVSPWGVAAIIVLVVYYVAGIRLALLAVAFVAWVVGAGLWDSTVQTIAFMLIAVVVSSLLGILIGIIAASSRRLDNVVRVLLDAMQAFPSFAYLVPFVVVFGAGDTAAIMVTIIWATPPIARLTAVGLTGVSVDTIEAARAAGANKWQLLKDVRLPMARASINAGLNQTVMFAISMATITALIGGTGLGQDVWSGLTRLEFGQALEPGIALVLLAMILDRATCAPQRARKSTQEPDGRNWVVNFYRNNVRAVIVAALAAVAVVVSFVVPSLYFADFNAPPTWLQFSLRNPINNAVTWISVHMGTFIDVVTNNVQLHGLNPLVSFMTWLPWVSVLILVAAVGYLSNGIRGAVLSPAAIFFIGALGLWTSAINTLAVVGVAVTLSLAVGFPIGVLMSRSDTVARIVRPILDFMQTLPIFLFVIPTVVVMGSGPVAGTLATVLYAVTPIIRLTNVGLRDVDHEVVEAAISSGATERQLLTQVRVPLGFATILVGVSQTILGALSMAVVSSFIGTPGLGTDIITAVTYSKLGDGLEAGTAMFLLAVVFDRTFSGLARRVNLVQHVRQSS